MALAPISPHALTVRRYDRDRFVTALFAPPARREALFALYAFNVEIARIRETVSEPMLGRIRLQWWRDALTRLQLGATVGHPVADDLGAIALDLEAQATFARLLDARECDMDEAPPATLTSLLSYVAGSAGSLTSLAARLLDGGHESSQHAADHVGSAWGLVGLMRAHAYHIKSRRLYLPAALLADHGLDLEAVLAGERSVGLARLAENLAEMALSHLQAARALRRDVPKAAIPALLVGRLADGYLTDLRHARYDLLDRRWSAVNGRPIRLMIARGLGRY